MPLPVVDYDRMRRIRMASQDPPSMYFNAPTRFCLLIMFVCVCILYKRWVNKKQRLNPKVSY